MMADGRALIASYQPEAVLNTNLIRQAGIQSNWQYRKYLTENSTQIAKQNFREACNDVGYFERTSVGEMGAAADTPNQAPYKYSSFMDNAKPAGYANSDLKDMYLSREQLNSRKFSPSISQDQLFARKIQQ